MIRFDQLFRTQLLALAEKYGKEDIGTIRYGNMLGSGDDFEIEVILSDVPGACVDDAANDDEGVAFPFLSLDLYVEEGGLVNATVKLGFGSDDSGGESESVSFNLDKNTTLKSLNDWFERNRVDFDISPDYISHAVKALELFLRCGKEALSAQAC